MSLAEADEIVARYVAGASMPLLAEMYTRSTGTVHALRDVLVQHAGVLHAPVQVPHGCDSTGREHRTYSLSYGGSSARTIAGWLYDPSLRDMRADRKHDVFLSVREA